MKRIASLLLMTVFFFQVIHAQNRYWVSSTPANWSGNHWSNTSGGAPDGAGPPNGIENAEFDGNGNGNCLIDVLASFNDLTVDGYTGIIDLNGNGFTVNGEADLRSGTISDTPGTSELTINSLDLARFSGTVFHAEVNCTASRIDLDGSTFNALFRGTKLGINDDNGNGGNVFNGDFVLNHHGNGGRIRLGVGIADIYNGNVTLNNRSRGQIEFADNSAGNSVSGNLTINLQDSASNIVIADGAASTLTVSGDVILTQSSTSNSNLFFGNNGDVNINGQLTYLNNSTGDNNSFYLANGANSAVQIDGTSDITNNSSASSNSRIYLGNEGDLTINSQMEITNNAVAANNYVYFNHSSNSAGVYNADILLNCSNPLANGFLFGNNGGAATLQAGKVIAIGVGGISEGRLYLRNINQLGGTAQALTLTSNARLDLQNCNFSGSVNFIAPRLFYRESSFQDNATLEKTAGSDDENYGGNRFNSDVTFTHSGNNRWLAANNVADTFLANVTVINKGSGTFYLADDGGVSSIAGDLNIIASGNARTMSFANSSGGSLQVNGDLTVNNSSSDNIAIYLANYGNLTVNGEVEITNAGTANTSQIYIAAQSSSSANFQSKLKIYHSGATTDGRVYVSDAGDLTIADSLIIVNASSANNSQVYVGDASTASIQLNGDVVISTNHANADGFYFGNRNANVSIAAGENLTIGSAGFANGELSLANVSMNAVSTQTLLLTSTAFLDIDNCTFASGVNFSAPRLFLDNTNIEGEAILAKTGSSDDQSQGGNIFNSHVTVNHSANGEFQFGNTLPDSIFGNLTVNLSGSDNFQFARSSRDNFIQGNVEVNVSGNAGGPNFYLNGDTSSSVIVNGTFLLNNNATASANTDHFIASSGDAILNGDVTINNSSTTTSNAQIWLSNSQYSNVVINGNLVVNNVGAANELDVFLADNGHVLVTGDVDIINDNSATNADVFLANASTSSFEIRGNLNGYNEGSGSSRNIYIANYGDVTIDGSLTLENSSDANSSNIYLAANPSSVLQLHGNVTLEATDAAVDNISFGENGGTTFLADLRTITIGASGFIGGDLTFRNFTQIGTTTQSISITGNGAIEHNNSNWGGDVVFNSPRVRMQRTTFQGTSSFAKTGGADDASIGGNVFEGEATFSHLGSNRFYLATFLPDTFKSNVIHLNNSNGGDFEFASNSANNYMAGNLTVTHSPTAGDSYFILARETASSIQIEGTTNIVSGGTPSNSDIHIGLYGDVVFNNDVDFESTIAAGTIDFLIGNGTNSTVNLNGNLDIELNGSANAERIYLGNNGDLNLIGELRVQSLGSSTTTDCYVADDATSVVNITGAVEIDNNGSGSSSRYLIGNSGDVTFNSLVELSNHSGASNSEIRVGNNSSSLVNFNGSLILENTNANGDGISFGESSGTVVIAPGQTVTIGAGGFVAGDLEFRNFTRAGATATSLTCTGTARIISYNSNWQDEVSFIAPQIITRGSNYASTAYLEKTGASDNQSVGGNSFAADVTFVNSGSGYLLLGNGTADSYGANVSLQNTGSDDLFFAYRGAGHAVSGNLTLENLGASANSNLIVADINTATLSIGGNVNIINNGSNTNNDVRFADAGDITIGGDLSIVNNGNATTSEIFVALESSSSLQVGGNVTIQTLGSGNAKRLRFARSGDILINGQLTSTNTSSAATSDLQFAESTSSSLIITGTASFTNSGTGVSSIYEIGDNGDITFQDDVTATNTSASTNSYIRFNQNSNSTNTFNGSIFLENTNALGDGIFFGGNNGSATLADGETISIGGGGFVAGDLFFRNFTQIGGTAQNITLSGTARFYPHTSTFNGALTVESPRFYNRNSTFNQNVSFTKTGATNEISYGGNTYNGNLTFTISGNAYQGMANNFGDDYNGDVTFIQSGTGYFRPAYNRDCTISGNLYYNFTTQTRFGDAAGSFIFDGTTDQSINDLAVSTIPYFEEMVVNKASGNLNLNTPIVIANDLTLTQGLVYSDAVNTLTFFDNATVTSASNVSHVIGPVNKRGNDAFNFPVGNGIQYRPIGIARVTTSAAEFQATYVDSSANALYSFSAREVSLDHLSVEEYWTLDRLNSTASADVILSWDTASGGIDVLAELRVARWDGAKWVNEGNASFTGNTTSGSLTSSTRVTDFSPFTLGSSTENNPLPVELISFNAECVGNYMKIDWKTATETNNDYFQVYGSKNGTKFSEVAKINGSGNSIVAREYRTYVKEAYQYFYLAQTDFDGSRKEYPVIQQNMCDTKGSLSLYPNPLTQGNLYIKGSDELQHIRIHDALGKLVYENNFLNQLSISSTLFKKGMYWVSLQSGESIETSKLIVK